MDRYSINSIRTWSSSFQCVSSLGLAVGSSSVEIAFEVCSNSSEDIDSLWYQFLFSLHGGKDDIRDPIGNKKFSIVDWLNVPEKHSLASGGELVFNDEAIEKTPQLKAKEMPSLITWCSCFGSTFSRWCMSAKFKWYMDKFYQECQYGYKLMMSWLQQKHVTLLAWYTAWHLPQNWSKGPA